MFYMNTSPVPALAVAVAALDAAWPEGPVEGSAAAVLVEVNRMLGQVRRLTDAATSLVASEIARQSRPELGASSLAKTQGHPNATRMLATTLGTSTGEAAKLVEVGDAVAPRLRLTGEAAPARHPHVGDALTAGRIGKDAAAAIIRMLDGIDHRVGPDQLDEAERVIAAQAGSLDLFQLRRLLLRVEAHLDPDGLEPKEEEQRARTGLTIRQDADGMILLTGKFDPARGASLVTLIDAMVSKELSRQRDENTTRGMLPKPVPVLQAEALLDIAAHYVGCDHTDEPLPGATVIVRIALDDLQNGTGAGTIDGIDHPVSAGTIRRLAAGGAVIPWMMGAGSEILDWGRRRRFFTRPQKLALAERDRGCIGCGAPTGRTRVHHLQWWSRGGPTDLDNGCLLCESCHHLIHDHGWDIRIDGPGIHAPVWLIPPAHVDPGRTPRPAAGRHYDCTNAA